MMKKTLSGIELGGAVSAAKQQDAISLVRQGEVILVTFDFQCSLNPGTFFMNAGVTGVLNEGETYLHRLLDACIFRVLPVSENASTGMIDFKCDPKVNFLNSEVD